MLPVMTASGVFEVVVLVFISLGEQYARPPDMGANANASTL